jgi:hypothetical protein
MAASNRVLEKAGAHDGDAALLGTFPLIFVTAVLFAASYITFLADPLLGPDRFPFWILLVALAVVASIGCVVSFFFATDEEREAAPTDVQGQPADSSPSAKGTREFGRPSPAIEARATTSRSSGGPSAVAGRGRGSPAPWDEDVLPPLPARGPRPVLTTLDDPGDIGRALEEIADIQRQLAARPAARPAPADAPARA